MAKKLIVCMSLLCIILAAVIVYIRLQTDREGPEIFVEDSDISVYTQDTTENELLKGVSAVDETDGDVSDTLTVESVYSVNDSTVVVSYAAKDHENNITKLKRELPADLELSEEEKEDHEEEQTPEEDLEDSEETSAVEGSEETETAQTPTPSPEPEQDEAELLKEEEEAEAEAMPSQNPRIYLTEYYVEIPVGSSWDPLEYVKEISDDSDDMYALWRKIQVEDGVDTAAAGTYECTYYVVDSQNNSSNNATIRVVVE